jgi:hypothetical protein
MFEEATMEDFDAAIIKAVTVAAGLYFDEAEEIHHSGSFFSIGKTDRRLLKFLNHLQAALEKGTDGIADTAISFMSSTALDKSELLSCCDAILRSFHAEVRKDADWRLYWLAETASDKALVESRLNYVNGIYPRALRRVAIGMTSSPTGSGSGDNIINAENISGNVQQGSPGATMNVAPELNIEKLKALLDIAERLVASSEKAEAVDLVKAEISTIRSEVGKPQINRSKVRGMLASLKTISEGALGNALGSELAALLDVLSGML